MKHTTKRFELKIVFSCNEEASVKVSDEKMESNCAIIGEAVARMFGFDKLDAGCFEKMSLNSVILIEDSNPS